MGSSSAESAQKMQRRGWAAAVLEMAIGPKNAPPDHPQIYSAENALQMCGGGLPNLQCRKCIADLWAGGVGRRGDMVGEA